jgi:hypothetical protein
METLIFLAATALLGIVGPCACAVLAHYADREN